MKLATTIRKSQKQNIALALTRFFAEELKLSHRKFKLVVMSDSKLIRESRGEGVTYRDLTEEKTIVIRFDSSLDVKTMIIVLAHEMIHVRQHVLGHLAYDRKNRPMWKGNLANHFPYAERPWEIEAYGKMSGLVAAFLDRMSSLQTA